MMKVWTSLVLALALIANHVSADASLNNNAFRGGAVKARAPPAPRGGKRGPAAQADSLEQFNADVTKVLTDLRGNKNDPTMKAMFHSRIRPTFAVTWTHRMWERHTSRARFIVQFIFWYQSALLKRVIPQLTVLMGWTYLVVYFLSNNKEFPLSSIKFPMTSLSLVSGFVASLLALRTNQGMSRLLEGRMAFGKVVLYTRDMASMVSNFIYEKDPQLALKLARHLATFSWLLKNFLRGTKASGGKEEDLIRTMLPTKADADYILRQRKMPVGVTMRLRQALAHCTHHHLLSTAEEIAIDHTISAMDLAIMTTERIIASPIPPLFTTHAGRLMCFYLCFLPVALYGSGSMNTAGILLTVGVVGYAMLGLDELSHMMEQPFKVAPLFHLCKNSMNDVADAFCIRPPALDATGDAPYQAPVEPTYHQEGEGFE